MPPFLYTSLSHSQVLLHGIQVTFPRAKLAATTRRDNLPTDLPCRRVFSNRPRLVNQDAKARHTTLTAAIAIRQLGTISCW